MRCNQKSFNEVMLAIEVKFMYCDMFQLILHSGARLHKHDTKLHYLMSVNDYVNQGLERFQKLLVQHASLGRLVLDLVACNLHCPFLRLYPCSGLLGWARFCQPQSSPTAMIML